MEDFFMSETAKTKTLDEIEEMIRAAGLSITDFIQLLEKVLEVWDGK